MENRIVMPGTLEVRARAGKPTMLCGFAAVFNSDSGDLGSFVERIAPGAFTAALARPDLDCRALVNHDPSQCLGRTKSGTLRLTQTDKGLYYEVDVPDTQAGRDILVSAQRGDCTQSSFSFSVSDGQTWSDNGTRRLITSVDQLFDVSPLTQQPAYSATSLQARSDENARAEAQKYLLAARGTSDEVEREKARLFLLSRKH